jgi:hypothetical protein
MRVDGEEEEEEKGVDEETSAIAATTQTLWLGETGLRAPSHRLTRRYRRPPRRNP